MLAGAVWAAPVHDAARRGDAEALRQAGPNQVNLPDEKGLTPLVLVIQNNHPECVEVLLQSGANPNLGNWSPLHEAALVNDLASTKILLLAKADPNRREAANGGTPLHVACFQGHLEVARSLLKAGAKPTIRDKEGFTPLFQAKDQGFPELVKLLKAAGGR
ncbi:MAG: ankyrin repeat domain-containing protein [Vulcanimicrobiota bacterium]